MMDTSKISLLVIMAVAFALGVAVTVFSFRLKRWNRRKNKEDDL